MPLEDYKYVKVIGAGGFGEAVLYVHKDKQQYVVKKMNIRNANMKDLADAERDKMANLKHEHIVLYKECFIDRGIMWLIMEYCSGGDLADQIEANSASNTHFSEDQIVLWTFQICLGLEYLHDNDTIHRDLKPQNIFLTATKCVKLGDFGVSRNLGAGDMATTMAGTILYFSPEQFRGQPYDNKVDIWALGCCVYEMMTFTHAINIGVLINFDLPDLKKTSYSDDLTQLYKSMLEQDAKGRPNIKQILQTKLMKLQQQKKNAVKATLPRQSAAVNELSKLGLGFNNNTYLVDSKGKRFVYRVSTDESKNEERYQRVAHAVTNYVQEVLELDMKLNKILIPNDAKAGDACSYIYATPDWQTNKSKLLVLIQGNGAPRAGVWARKVIVNDNIDAGSQIPWVKRGIADGYAVFILNPNGNCVTIAGKQIAVRGSETDTKHLEYVWDNYIVKTPAKDVFVVADSAGGPNLINLASTQTSKFVTLVKAVAFTDARYTVTQQSPIKLTSFLHQHGRHWVASDLPLDQPVSSDTFDAPKVSAGETRHEWATWSSFNSIFDFFSSQQH